MAWPEPPRSWQRRPDLTRGRRAEAATAADPGSRLRHPSLSQAEAQGLHLQDQRAAALPPNPLDAGLTSGTSAALFTAEFPPQGPNRVLMWGGGRAEALGGILFIQALQEQHTHPTSPSPSSSTSLRIQCRCLLLQEALPSPPTPCAPSVSLPQAALSHLTCLSTSPLNHLT